MTSKEIKAIKKCLRLGQDWYNHVDAEVMEPLAREFEAFRGGDAEYYSNTFLIGDLLDSMRDTPASGSDALNALQQDASLLALTRTREQDDGSTDLPDFKKPAAWTTKHGQTQKFRFLDLPGELRDMVYGHLLLPVREVFYAETTTIVHTIPPSASFSWHYSWDDPPSEAGVERQTSGDSD
ncbi:hypothetical protein BU16DRAFT_556967 [Lophium mytilinum]|uniref:Uncharacterized protein n=1 Tax=Lophium mytilinum TaxID=390894 RepID=A0A6A6R6S5_9PEZI|nr:hypothetical protein BU16DRAFT_556967 [Lophium mytilinum]